MIASALLAAASPSPTTTPTAIDPSRVTPGVLGFLAVAFMAVAVFFLWKSMNKQLKRVDFDEAATDRKKPRPDPSDDAAAPTSTGTAGAVDAPDPAAPDEG